MTPPDVGSTTDDDHHCRVIVSRELSDGALVSD
jgi:hypothetical protein